MHEFELDSQVRGDLHDLAHMRQSLLNSLLEWGREDTCTDLIEGRSLVRSIGSDDLGVCFAVGISELLGAM